MKKITLKAFIALMFIGLCLLIFTFSCGPPQLSLGDIIFSSEIEKDSNKPIEPDDDFKIDVGQIYATIRYSGVQGKDIWKFKWYKVETGKIIFNHCQKFNDSQPDSFFKGIVASDIQTIDSSKIIPPGEYGVDFYLNDQLKKTANFKVINPDIEILELSLANQIDQEGTPINKTSQFYPNDTIYACIKLSCLIQGNSLEAVWLTKDNSVINEDTTEITENYYKPHYVYFSLPLSEEKYTLKPGKYSVEILLNDDMEDRYYFEVFEIEPVTFNEKNIYSNVLFDFEIIIPDSWIYNEKKVGENLIVYLNTPNNEPGIFSFTEKDPASLDPYEETTKMEAGMIAAENNWTFIGSNSRTYNLENGLPTFEASYLYEDFSKTEYIILYSFTEYKDKVFIYSLIVNRDEYGEIAEEVCYTMLDSLTIKNPPDK